MNELRSSDDAVLFIVPSVHVYAGMHASAIHLSSYYYKILKIKCQTQGIALETHSFCYDPSSVSQRSQQCWDLEVDLKTP